MQFNIKRRSSDQAKKGIALFKQIILITSINLFFFTQPFIVSKKTRADTKSTTEIKIGIRSLCSIIRGRESELIRNFTGARLLESKITGTKNKKEKISLLIKLGNNISQT